MSNDRVIERLMLAHLELMAAFRHADPSSPEQDKIGSACWKVESIINDLRKLRENA